MEGGLAGIHEIVGGLVVVALVILAILAAAQATGRGGDAVRMMSFVAAGLYALQILLGLLLLGGGFRNSTMHYVLGLLVIVPIGLQQTAGRRFSAQNAGVATMIWALAAAFLSVIAYMTGLQGVGGSP
jgi:hypothetical protein